MRRENPFFSIGEIVGHTIDLKKFYTGGTRFTKIAWLAGYNLMALEKKTLCFMHVADDTLWVREQSFDNKEFVTFAVDPIHPWQFIAFTDEKELLYCNLSSTTISYKDDQGKEVQKTFKNKACTYRVLMRRPLNEMVQKLFFYNNRIGYLAMKTEAKTNQKFGHMYCELDLYDLVPECRYVNFIDQSVFKIS